MTARVTSAIHEHIVTTWLNGDERGFDDETDLQSNGILDSFSTLALVAFLDETFGITLEPADINAETFHTVNSIAALVSSRLPPQ
jgi:acyl carrier protein